MEDLTMISMASMGLAMQDDDSEVCESCGNVYRVELLKESEDWNDFGYRHCHFCGEMTDDYAAMHEKLKQRRIERAVESGSIVENKSA